MQSFEFVRMEDPAAAIAAAAKSNTAQQGASVRFLAGGTTLVDLMKLNVERPEQVLDINRLPLDKIESLGRRWTQDRRDRPQFRPGSP